MELGEIAQRLRAHVEALARDFVPRDYLHPENIARAIAYMEHHFATAGMTVEKQRYRARGAEHANLIARCGGTQGSRVIVGAHYDAWGGLPGADDNASGVAALLELTHIVPQDALRRPVELVAFANEEPPFFQQADMGSMVHARSLRAAEVEVRAMLCLEMLGYFRDEPGSQTLPDPSLEAIYGTRGDFVVIVGRPEEESLAAELKQVMSGAADLPVHSINPPSSTGFLNLSDHTSYWHYGYPAVMVTDSAHYRNPNYHQASDQPETLDYKRMAKCVQQLKAGILQLANS